MNVNLLLPGDILVTRNYKEEDNGMPGYWNHIAIFTGNSVVEAQMPPWDTVIQSEIEEFVKRYARIQVYRWKNKPPEFGEKIANHARTLVGKPYNMWASLFFKLRRKFNCVTVGRSSYRNALGYDPGWKLPDDVTKDRKLYLITEKK